MRFSLFAPLEETVGGIDGLTPVRDDPRSERVISRTVIFAYEPRAPAREGLSPSFRLSEGQRDTGHTTRVPRYVRRRPSARAAATWSAMRLKTVDQLRKCL